MKGRLYKPGFPASLAKETSAEVRSWLLGKCLHSWKTNTTTLSGCCRLLAIKREKPADSDKWHGWAMDGNITHFYLVFLWLERRNFLLESLWPKFSVIATKYISNWRCTLLPQWSQYPAFISKMSLWLVSSLICWKCGAMQPNNRTKGETEKGEGRLLLFNILWLIIRAPKWINWKLVLKNTT